MKEGGELALAALCLLLAEPGPSPMSAFYSTFSPRTNTNW